MTEQPAVMFAELENGETLVVEVDELVMRQVHPDRYHNGRISSQAFEPNSRDAGKMSCTRGSAVSAADAKAEYAATGLKTAGGAPVTVAEVQAGAPLQPEAPNAAGLRAVDDYRTDPDNLPRGHCYIDFRPLGASRITKKAKQLAFYANKRGIQP